MASVCSTVLWDSSLNKLCCAHCCCCCCWWAVQCWTGYWGKVLVLFVMTRQCEIPNRDPRCWLTHRDVSASDRQLGRPEQLPEKPLPWLTNYPGWSCPFLTSGQGQHKNPHQSLLAQQNTDKYCTVGGYLVICVGGETEQDVQHGVQQNVLVKSLTTVKKSWWVTTKGRYWFKAYRCYRKVKAITWSEAGKFFHELSQVW